MPGTSINTFPVGAPSVAGTNITVDYYAKNPLAIVRIVQQFAQAKYFLSDLLFSPAGTTESGAVIFSQVTGLDDQFTDGDFEMVAPGQEFPIVGTNVAAPLTAMAGKYGGKMQITREARTRNQLSKFRNDLTAMNNTMLLKSDARAIAAVNAAAAQTLTAAAAVSWNNPAAQIRKDLETARHTLSRSILGITEGYMADTLVIGRDIELDIRLNDQLMDTFYKAHDPATAAALLSNGKLDGLLGFKNVRTNPFIGARDVMMTEAGRLGGIAAEYALLLEQWYVPDAQSTWYQLSKSDVPFVENPKALIKITNA